MVSTKLFSFFLLASLLALGRSNGETTVEKVNVAVEGMVYCQNCSYVGSWSLTGARPLAAAEVNVTCKDHKGRVVLYELARTNAKGYFLAPLDVAVGGYFNPLDACSVRLVASSDVHCKVLTNVNYGLQGTPLRDENKTYTSGSRCYTDVYAAGPLAFRQAGCPPKSHRY